MKRYDRFRFDYAPAAIRYGTGSAAELSDELAEHGFDRALVVTGSAVGDNAETMDPVLDGLGDRLGGVFAEVTPDKSLSTAIEGLEAVREHQADVVVALGGGSSLDVTKAIRVLSSRYDSFEAAAREFERTGSLDMGEGDPIGAVAVPTTLAGADLSIVSGLSAAADGGWVSEDTGGGLSHPALMPTAVVHDPALFATTPEEILAGSAMNGFNKGLETLYSSQATPVTDATASYGLGRMAEGLETLGESGPSAEVLEPAVEGLLLVQFGIGRPNATTLSLVHAFGHTLRDGFDIQQGTAHAVITPAALQYLFDRVDGRRDLLADALDVADADDPTEAVVERVTAVRDGLDLPSRLRDLPNADRSILSDIAEATIEDDFMANVPENLAPSSDDIEELLEAAW